MKISIPAFKNRATQDKLLPTQEAREAFCNYFNSPNIRIEKLYKVRNGLIKALESCTERILENKNTFDSIKFYRILSAMSRVDFTISQYKKYNPQHKEIT